MRYSPNIKSRCKGNRVPSWRAIQGIRHGIPRKQKRPWSQDQYWPSTSLLILGILSVPVPCMFDQEMKLSHEPSCLHGHSECLWLGEHDQTKYTEEMDLTQMFLNCLKKRTKPWKINEIKQEIINSSTCTSQVAKKKNWLAINFPQIMTSKVVSTFSALGLK